MTIGKGRACEPAQQARLHAIAPSACAATHSPLNGRRGPSNKPHDNASASVELIGSIARHVCARDRSPFLHPSSGPAVIRQFSWEARAVQHGPPAGLRNRSNRSRSKMCRRSLLLALSPIFERYTEPRPRRRVAFACDAAFSWAPCRCCANFPPIQCGFDVRNVASRPARRHPKHSPSSLNELLWILVDRVIGPGIGAGKLIASRAYAASSCVFRTRQSSIRPDDVFGAVE